MLYEAIEALLNNRTRSGVDDFRSRRSLTLGVDERKRLSEFRFIDEGDGLLEILFRLTGETDDDIRGEGDIGNAIADTQHQVKILFARVLAIHEFQDA